LSFAGCNNDHIAPCYDQQRKYAKAGFGKYVGKGVYVAKGKYIEYAKDGVCVAKSEYGKYAKEEASLKEGHNEPLAKAGGNEPVAKDHDWAGYSNEPLATGAINCVGCARQQ
jgi:hypothetical protein